MGAFSNLVMTASLAASVLAHPGHGLEKRDLAFDGTIYTGCVNKGEVALTFDDGPFTYTQDIVNKLNAAGHKATFFQNGQNYDSIYNYASVLASMIAGGHQIGSHTWSHADLATLTADEITSQMNQLEVAHVALIGKAPTYMRPPYLSTNDLAVTTLTALGYHIISVDIDTLDYTYGPAGQSQTSVDLYESGYAAGGSISLNHDPYETTADIILPAIIQFLATKGLTSVTVGTCLGDPEANWYRGSTAKPGVSSAAASASGSAAASGSAYPSVAASAKGNGTAPPYPTGSIKAYPSSGAQPGKPCGGGDTEPGHGPNAGRGALPGHKGEGNNGWTGSYAGAGTNASSNGTSPAPASPSYYVNSASTITGSALLIGAAFVAFFL